MDTKQLQRFERPGPLGRWAIAPVTATHGPGKSFAHCVVDDHTRLAYVELRGQDSAPDAAATLRPAIALFAEQGCESPQAVMTDNALNALIYTRSRAFGQVLSPSTEPVTSRSRPGTASSSAHPTLEQEWLKSQVWPSSPHRDRALGSFLRYYNRRDRTPP